jgi:glycosyltransferase involved in cell wall biosynthesis
MPDFYRGLSCFVLMSIAEGCSGVTFEAMASGIPVISTKVGWHGEQNAPGIMWADRPKVETPESIERGVQELTEKILTVKAMSDSSRREVGNCGRIFAENYSWDRLALEWKEAFDFFIAESRK